MGELIMYEVYNLSTNSPKLNNSYCLKDVCDYDLKTEMYHLESENFDLTDCDDDLIIILRGES